MKRALAKLYLDHNVSLRLVAPLQEAGHDVATARDFDLARLPDDAQLLTTVREERVFITHNRADFLLLHEAWLTWPAALGVAFPPHPGILVLDLAPYETLFDTLSAWLVALPASRLANRRFWWHRHDGWRHRVVGTNWEPSR